MAPPPSECWRTAVPSGRLRQILDLKVISQYPFFFSIFSIGLERVRLGRSAKSGLDVEGRISVLVAFPHGRILDLDQDVFGFRGESERSFPYRKSRKHCSDKSECLFHRRGRLRNKSFRSLWAPGERRNCPADLIDFRGVDRNNRFACDRVRGPVIPPRRPCP